MQPPASDRRICPRWPLKLPVRYGASDQLCEGMTFDVSECGAGFRGTLLYPIGSPIELEFCFSFPGAEWVKLSAVVRRHTEGGMGAQFLTSPAESTEILQSIYRELAISRGAHS